MGTITYIRDTLRNIVSGLGTERDKSSHSEHRLVMYTDQQLLEIYRSSWLARKMVDLPAFDSVRKWRDWQGTAAHITLVEAEEKRLGLQAKILEAQIKARIFGGAGIYIGTEDGADPSVPLDIERIKKGGVKYLHVILGRDLQPAEPIKILTDPHFGRPEYYTMGTGPIAGAGPQTRIHPSRIIPFVGELHVDPERTVTALGLGWGDSILLSRMDALNQAESVAANVSSLVFEAKVDVVKVPDLMSHLADPVFRDRLVERFNLAAMAKGNNGVLMLDNEEDYQQKSASFATLPDLIDRFFQIASAAADIPATRFMAQSPAGMNATGESDLRNYYDNIAAMQNIELTPTIHPLDEALIRSALGTRPTDLHYIWSSLWQMSDKERAEIGKMNMEIIVGMNNTGLYPPEALANAGANMMVESSVMPGILEAIEKAGGLPDYDLGGDNDNDAGDGEDDEQTPRRVAANDATPKTLYVRRDVLNHQAIRDHYSAQGFDVTVQNLHVTVIYSDAPVDWFAVGDAWEEKIELPAGGARDHEFFGPPGLEDSPVLMISSRALKWRHEEFKGHGAETTFEEYQPHITLRYKDPSVGDTFKALEPYRGRIVLGPEIFEEVKENAGV